MKQTRLGSWIEAWTNVAVGLGVSVLGNFWLLPFWGFRPTAGESLSIGLVFTTLSLLRSYALRRVFNKIRMFHHEHG